MKQKGFAKYHPALGFTPILILVLIALAILGYFGYKNFWPKLQNLTSPTPTATPDPTANWETYENSQIGFQFKYPPEAQLSTTDAETRIHVTVGKLNIVCGYGLNFTIIFKGDDLVVRNDLTTYPFQVAGREAERYDKTDNLEGCRNNRSSIFIKNTPNSQINDLAILITDNSNKQEWSNQILSTFKFTNSENGYICPASGWANCMPILDEAGQKACSSEAMTWYKANCPNFKGGAY